MRKLLLLLFLTVFIEADAQFFNARPAIDLWRDSVMQSVRLKPVEGLHHRLLPHFGNEAKRSIMFQNRTVEQPVNPALLRLGRFVVNDPPPIFQYNYSYEDQTIVGALLHTFVDILIDNSSKPKSKPRKKTIDY